jgi:hypothetical protein
MTMAGSTAPQILEMQEMRSYEVVMTYGQGITLTDIIVCKTDELW